MRFSSVPVRLVSNQDFPSKVKTDEFGHAFTNDDGTPKMTTHFRMVEFEEIDDQCLAPDRLNLKLFNDQADRFDVPVGTEGVLLFTVENRVTREGKEVIEAKIKNFTPLA